MTLHRIAISTTFFICGFVYTNWSTRLPRIQDVFSLSNVQIGLVLLCVALGSLTSMPLTGWLIAKRGSRTATVWSLVLFSASLFSFQSMSQTWHLVAGFYGIGFFTGALDVAMNTQAVVLEKKYHKPIMSSFHAIFSLGMMIGAFCSSFIIKHFDSLAMHFNIVSVLCMVASMASIPFLVQDSGSSTQPVVNTPHNKFEFLNSAVLLLGILAFCAMLAEGSIADWGTNYLKNTLNADEFMAPIGISIFSIAMMAGRFLGDGIRQRFSDTTIILYSSALAAVGLALALGILSVYVFMGGLVLVGLGLSAIVPIIYSLAGNIKSLPNGVGLSIVTTLGYAGFLAGPPVIGFVATNTSLRTALFLVVVLLVILSILSLRLKQK